MVNIVGIRFRNTGKLYYFSPGKYWPEIGTRVIVETARGVELGEVITGVKSVSEESVVGELKPIMRLAEPRDIELAERQRKYEQDIFPVVKQLIDDANLGMKLVKVERMFDDRKLVAYFTADGYVQFTELARKLREKTRLFVELRQIGARDEAALVGGIGICGREICCRTSLSHTSQVTMSMIKTQQLKTFDQSKTAGYCGMHMCCMRYEYDMYKEVTATLPKVGKRIVTPDGIGELHSINVPKENVLVRISAQKGFDLKEYPINAVRRLTQDEIEALRPKEEKAKYPKHAEEAAPEEQTEE